MFVIFARRRGGDVFIERFPAVAGEVPIGTSLRRLRFQC